MQHQWKQCARCRNANSETRNPPSLNECAVCVVLSRSVVFSSATVWTRAPPGSSVHGIYSLCSFYPLQVAWTSPASSCAVFPLLWFNCHNQLEQWAKQWLVSTELETGIMELWVKRKESYTTYDKRGLWSQNLIFAMEKRLESFYVSETGAIKREICNVEGSRISKETNSLSPL